MKRIIIILAFIVISCKGDIDEKIEYDKNGNVVSKMYVSKNKKLDSIIYYKKKEIFKTYFNKSDLDSAYCKVFNYDNKLISEGNTLKLIKYGNWKFYDSKGKIRKIVEFKNICGKEYPNQEWNYDENENLINQRSNYYIYKFKNVKFKAKESNELIIKYIPFIKKANYFLYFSPEFDNQFCNIEKVKKNGLGTNKDSIIFKINVGFENPGKEYFNGYIVEEESADEKHKSEKWTYISIPIIIY